MHGRAAKVLLAFCAIVSVATPAEQQTRFVITGPTLISFFLNYTDDGILADGGNEALYDFGHYLPAAEDKLREAGVQVHAVLKVKSFQVKIGSRWHTFQPRGNDVGYYFIAPGRKPRVEFGIQETEGILDIARNYFRLKTLPPRPRPRAETKRVAPPLPEFLITEHGAGKVNLTMARDEILRLFPPSLAMEVNAGSPEIQIFMSQKSRTRKVALRLFLSPDTSRIVKMEILDRRFRSLTNLGPGSTFGELLRGARNLSLTMESGRWAVTSGASCMTFLLDVDETTTARLATEERIQWQDVLPKTTPVRAVSIFASGCHL